MRQSRRPHHECEAEGDPLIGPLVPPGEDELGLSLLQLGHGLSVANLRDQVEKTQFLGDEEERQQEGRDENDVLDLLVADHAHHSREEHIGDDHDGPGNDGQLVVHAEDPLEHLPDALVLAHGIDEGDDQRDDGGQEPGGLGVIPVADEVGRGELPVVANLGRHQDQQQDVAAAPAQDVGQSEVSLKVEEPRHPQKAGGAHPVAGDGHPRGQWTDPAAGHPVLLQVADAGQDSHQHEQEERRRQDQGGSGSHADFFHATVAPRGRPFRIPPTDHRAG